MQLKLRKNIIGLMTGLLPDGWERSETTNGIPYYIKYEYISIYWKISI